MVRADLSGDASIMIEDSDIALYVNVRSAGPSTARRMRLEQELPEGMVDVTWTSASSPRMTAPGSTEVAFGVALETLDRSRGVAAAGKSVPRPGCRAGDEEDCSASRGGAC
ncbi:hypothetical protein [Sorangium sp. So ce1151]|uniref:hypothetical protein n=1 Tax=Sorangium sp. So ce1151 TaxID=3133332 RepID=UPI003F622059